MSHRSFLAHTLGLKLNRNRGQFSKLTIPGTNRLLQTAFPTSAGVHIYEDFVGPAGTVLPVPWMFAQHSLGPICTAPDYVMPAWVVDPAVQRSNSGIYRLNVDGIATKDATALYMGDISDDTPMGHIVMTTGAFFETRFRINEFAADKHLYTGSWINIGLGAGDQITAMLADPAAVDETTVWLRCGLTIVGDDVPATARKLWAAVPTGPGNMLPLIDTGLSYTAGEWITFGIDFSNGHSVLYYVNGVCINPTIGPLDVTEVLAYEGSGVPFATGHKVAIADPDVECDVDYFNIYTPRIA